MGAETSRLVVVGGGLAGLAAAVWGVDAGMQVTLLERRHRLGGATWSFERGGIHYDNGQHVFMRCFESYLQFLERIGSGDKVFLQSRLNVSVLGADSSIAKLTRTNSPAPLHLMRSLLRYSHMSLKERITACRTALALRKINLDAEFLEDKFLDAEFFDREFQDAESQGASNKVRIDDVSFGEWLRMRGASDNSLEALWNLITLPTANLPADKVSLKLAAMIFQVGLLTEKSAADIGISAVPLSELHADAALGALLEKAATVRTKTGVSQITTEPLGVEVVGETVADGEARQVAETRETAGTATEATGKSSQHIPADAVICAVPHTVAGDILPQGTVSQQTNLKELGTSPIINVHLVYDEPVLDYPFVAGLNSEAQFIFDRTASAKLQDGRQCLGISLSAADEYLSWQPAKLIEHMTEEVAKLLPKARKQTPKDCMVTKEVQATFAGTPGTARLRPQAQTNHPAIFLAGAYTDTGWPATMEGAVRSGITAAELAAKHLLCDT